MSKCFCANKNVRQRFTLGLQECKSESRTTTPNSFPCSPVSPRRSGHRWSKPWIEDSILHDARSFLEEMPIADVCFECFADAAASSEAPWDALCRKISKSFKLNEADKEEPAEEAIREDSGMKTVFWSFCWKLMKIHNLSRKVNMKYCVLESQLHIYYIV